MKSNTGIKSTKSIKSLKNIEAIVAKLLDNRGIRNEKEKAEFFSPTNPKDIPIKEFGVDQKQLDKAVKRIKKAIKDKEKIVVYGDYDVDGICATAILWETLHALGADATPFIPSRFVEGYGLSPTGIKSLKLKIENCSLIITVDSGIVAHEGVKTAKELGIDVIITDHHEPGVKKPDVLAVVHTTKVSGSAVSWILSRALVDSGIRILGTNTPTLQHSNTPSGDHLGLVALGTIADVLPLVGLNRAIAVHGLKILRNTTRPGICAICKEAGIEQKEIDTFHIGFVIAPRLNAMGRVEHAMESLRLLCTSNNNRARELASLVGTTNKLRQDKTENVLNHVESVFEPAWNDGNLPKILLVHHESYEEGVIGIAAGRLVDKYHRPTIVVSRGEKTSKASVRSIAGVNIVELLREIDKDLFINIGGHPMAAGFTISTDKLELLAQQLQKVGNKIKDEVLVKNTRVDMELPFNLINGNLHKEIVKFAPFGYGNPEPTFSAKKVQVEDCRLIGKEKNHIKFVLSQNSNTRNVQSSIFDAIAFNMGEMFSRLSEGQVEIIYCIDMNEWNGKKSLQLKIKKIIY